MDGFGEHTFAGKENAVVETKLALWFDVKHRVGGTLPSGAYKREQE